MSAFTPFPASVNPPGTMTRPSGSTVDAVVWRAWVIDPVGVQVPVAGLYSSAVAVRKVKLHVAGGALGHQRPPAASTWPFGSSVAVARPRRTFIEPVGVHVFVAGS